MFTFMSKNVSFLELSGSRPVSGILSPLGHGNSAYLNDSTVLQAKQYFFSLYTL